MFCAVGVYYNENEYGIFVTNPTEENKCLKISINQSRCICIHIDALWTASNPNCWLTGDSARFRVLCVLNNDNHP